MFTVAELEAAAKVVHASMPPTPQFAWPLLRQRTGVDVVVKHENHTPIGAFKVRGGIVYVGPAQARAAGCEGRHHGDARQSRTVARLRLRAQPASPARWWCRSAIRPRRTPR